MRKFLCGTVLSFGLSGLLSCCVPVQSGSVDSGTEAQMEAQSEKAIEASMAEPAEKPCEAVFEDFAAKARATMKTVHGACQEKRIEANPMWSMQYDGTVRIRVYDAAGNLVYTEERKP